MYASKLELWAEDTPYNRFYVKDTDGFEKKVYTDKLAPKGQEHFVKAEDGVARIRKGLYALYGEETTIYKIMEDTFLEHEKCELVNIEYLKLSDPFMSLKKRSQFKELLKVK